MKYAHSQVHPGGMTAAEVYLGGRIRTSRDEYGSKRKALLEKKFRVVQTRVTSGNWSDNFTTLFFKNSRESTSSTNLR